MQHQLRIYAIKAGAMDEFIAGWREHIVPVRTRHGFTVAQAWTNTEAGKYEFVWLIGYAGEDGYAAADARYYAHPDRAGLAWDPMPYIERMDLRLLDPVPVDHSSAPDSPAPTDARA